MQSYLVLLALLTQFLLQPADSDDGLLFGFTLIFRWEPICDEEIGGLT